MKKPIATAFLLFCIVLFSAYSNQEYINSIATHFLLKKYKENDVILVGEKEKDQRIQVMP